MSKNAIATLAFAICITYFALTVSAANLSEEILERIPKLKHVKNAAIAALFISLLVGCVVFFVLVSSSSHRKQYNATIAHNKNQSAPMKESTEAWIITAYLVSVTICLMVVTFTLFKITDDDLKQLSQSDQDKVKFAKISAILNFIFTFIGWIVLILKNRSKLTLQNIKSTYGYGLQAKV